MSGYGDPELLIAEWLHERLDLTVWADPRLPSDWPFDAALGHLQRAPGEGEIALSLDAALLDLDWFAKRADHARAAAQRARTALLRDLPGYTWPSGLTVSGVTNPTPPFWAPDPEFKRSATYRVVLHGVTAD
ncbi:hypothetical protein [Verrucosispora sp. TAA-831]|uniref:hypothetical protein n=1 Tax=Verrucosispora sp. TAA-831 TaxID=3422227 RepID=UPI003D6FFD58